MTELLHDHREAIWWIVSISLAVFIGSLVLVPWLVVKIPEDYFLSRRRPKTRFAVEHPVLRWTIWSLRNIVGTALILAGIAMLVLPGQGVLTIAVGLILLDFPGKHRLERRLIALPAVIKSINWLRRKAHVGPLRIPKTS